MSRRKKDQSMRLTLLCGLIVAVLAGSAFAQEATSPQQRGALADLWLVRSQTITEDLVKDAAGFTPSGRALVWARLGQAWWRDDPEQAPALLLKSIQLA